MAVFLNLTNQTTETGRDTRPNLPGEIIAIATLVHITVYIKTHDNVQKHEKAPTREAIA